MKIVAVVQARVGSSRLPGKVMRAVAGAPLLERMLERLRHAAQLDEIVVATTTLADDDPIRRLCRALDLRCVDGHPTDLLDRHLVAAEQAKADVVVKIPSDCPLIDPRIIDRVVACFREQTPRVDYMSNLHPATYPDGNDVEVVPVAVLAAAAREATRPHEREHTTPFIWDQPERFKLRNVAWETGLDFSMTHRLTVDYVEDLRLVRSVFRALWWPGAPPFSLADILAFLASHPEVFALNRALAGVNWYRHCLRELRHVTSAETVVMRDEA